MNIVLSVLLYILSMTAYAGDAMSIDVDSSQSSFEVSLASNPTTGFQWSIVSFDKELLTLTSVSFQRPDSRLIGAGGHTLFTFSLNKGKSYPKTTSIMFKYARPWEKSSSNQTIQNVSINFTKPSS